MKTNGKKLFIPILSAMFAGCLFGCSESGVIPNDCYCPEGAVTDGYFVLYEGDSDPRMSFCWEIKGNKARQWTSGYVSFKADIVEREDKIYFEGYTTGNSQIIYEVTYDESTESMILAIIPGE